MPFIGNQPAEAFSSFQKQDFTTSATTSYTLDHPVSNQNEIALFINFVRQEPTAAYTASGTSLTLTSATSSSDDMYCVYLGKAVQTVNPASGSVGSSQVAASIITGQTALGATPADTDELLISDAGTLKRVDYSYLKSSNTPSFFSTNGSAQTISTATLTKIEYPTEVFDTDSAFASNKFTVPSGKAGKYFFSGGFKIGDATDFNELRAVIYKNGSALYNTNQANHHYESAIVTAVLDLSVSDYVEIYGYHSKGSNADTLADSNSNYFMGFKLI